MQIGRVVGKHSRQGITMVGSVFGLSSPQVEPASLSFAGAWTGTAASGRIEPLRDDVDLGPMHMHAICIPIQHYAHDQSFYLNAHAPFQSLHI